MAMVLLEHGPVQQWLDAQHGGDKVIALTRVMSPANDDVTEFGSAAGNVGSTEETRKLFGLDLENRSWLLSRRAGLLTLTATHFYVLKLGGLKEKIKETSFDAPRAEMQFAAHDLTVDGRNWRHWLVTGFPDGRYLLEPQVLGKGVKSSKIAPGSNAFLTELGDQVQHRSSSAPGS